MTPPSIQFCPAAEADQQRRELRRLEDELVHGISGRVVAIAPPVPGSRAAVEAEMLRREGAKLEAAVAAQEGSTLLDLATLLAECE